MDFVPAGSSRFTVLREEAGIGQGQGLDQRFQLGRVDIQQGQIAHRAQPVHASGWNPARPWRR